MNLFEDERKNKPILGFFGEYRFLSNYHLCTCTVVGIPFISSEHAYMYLKSFDQKYQKSIIDAPTPAIARKLGQKVALRPDWNEYRLEAMFIALKAKFKNDNEANLLLATGDSYLEETNYWGDRFWGVCNNQGLGSNHLGKLLMQVRSNLHKVRSGL